MRSRSTDANGFLVLDKPEGITSFEALGTVKRTFGTGRVGHAGTLDRFARGVLVALVGRYARLSEYFTASAKIYLAGIRFGTETDTLDPEGRVIAEGPVPDRGILEKSLPAFTGEILQAPPAYSAVHIAGKRAYERALAGEDVHPEPRPVTVHSLELLEYEDGLARLRVRCSRGTYIRSLARDIAAACGTRAHLETLVREASGPFRREDGVPPESAGPADLRALDPELSDSLGLKPVRLAPGQETFFLRGGPLTKGRFVKPPEGDGLRGVFSEEGTFLGVLEIRQGVYSYRVVLGSAP
ncbi:MAG: tRNA pseudouridine(55) synthase TruB [Treponema sp.]|nr:tRNA pseudouridine(55) synthase TruB [Treponema sp.]